MQIKIIKTYPDKLLNRVVTAGETLTVTKERGEKLIGLGYAEKDSNYSAGTKSEGEKPYGTAF